MKFKLKNIVFLLASIIILNVVIVQANVFTNKNQITVEVLYNNTGEDFSENIVFDDGSKLSDYSYTIKYLPEPKSTSKVEEYFNYVAWITRDGVTSLSLDPNSNVRTNSSIKNQAWEVLSDETEGVANSMYWQNTKVMKWQYDCHYTFASNKDYWNLEPHRTASNYLEVVFKKCNP